MKYFFDTEFLEGPQLIYAEGHEPLKSKPTIDLISIAIVAEDNREYSALSNEFNLPMAWQDDWIRTNVLYPIFLSYYPSGVGPEKPKMEIPPQPTNWFAKTFHRERVPENKLIEVPDHTNIVHVSCTYPMMEQLLDTYGKSLKVIGKEIQDFVAAPLRFAKTNTKPEFYAYYCNYDWVVFCWIFGKMIELPENFPMYCNDVKVLIDQKLAKTNWFKDRIGNSFKLDKSWDVKRRLEEVGKHFRNLPQNESEHLAIEDARWTKKMYEFIDSLVVSY